MILKKLLISLLATTILLSFSACGKTANDSGNTKNTTNQFEEVQESKGHKDLEEDKSDGEIDAIEDENEIESDTEAIVSEPAYDVKEYVLEKDTENSPAPALQPQQNPTPAPEPTPAQPADDCVEDGLVY